MILVTMHAPVIIHVIYVTADDKIKVPSMCV